MSASLLFEHFPVVSRAPGGVQHVRHAIRQLAIQGRLTKQLSVDGHGNDFLEQVESHKADTDESSSRRNKPAVAHGSQGLSYAIPQNWTWAPLGDIVINRDSERVPLSKAVRNVQKKKLYDYYGASGVIDQVENFLFNKPLLLIGEDGANLINRSTPIAFIAYGEYWVNNHAHVLDGISLDFLKYLELFINSISLESYVTGTAQPKMNQAKMHSIPVAIPPAPEQKRIVAKVDELMGLCDRLESQLTERAKLLPLLSQANHARFVEEPTEENLKAIFHEVATQSIGELRRMVLDLAVRGRLVSQDTNDSPAVAEVSNLRMGSEPLQLPLVDAKSLHEIPDSWVWVRLKDLAPEFQNGASSRGEAGGVPVIVLRLADITDRRISWSSPRTIPIKKSDLDKYSLLQGDILITRVNGSADIVGTFVHIDEAIDAIYCDHFIRMRIDSELALPEFMTLLGESALIRGQILELFVTTAGQKTVNQNHIRSLAIPMPPVNEQRRIVDTAKKLMNVIDQLDVLQNELSVTAESFSAASVAAVTNTRYSENENMQPPQTVVVTALKLALNPETPEAAPLATLLAESDSSVSAKELWTRSGLQIDEFYRQLKAEIANGWIAKPEPATVKEVEAD